MATRSYIQGLFAERIGGKMFGKRTKLQKSEKIKMAQEQTKNEHPELTMIDLSVGEPDAMADAGVIAELIEASNHWENRGYTGNGRMPFKEAAAEYMNRVYGVEGIDAETEVIHSIGSKSALAMLAQAFINPGDVTLMTVPGHSAIGTMTEYLGGEVYKMPLTEENKYLPDLKAIPEDILQRAKLLYINYPNNPTGAFATVKFFRDVIALAKKYHIVVVQDAAYAALTFDGQKPFSFLSVKGAKDVGVELQSLSKAFNMTGWRLGFVVGNSLVVKAFGQVKESNDSGQFHGIQLAGKYALEHPEITEKTAEKYSRRHDMLVKTLCDLGFKAKKPKASFYLYVKAPKGIEGGPKFKTAEDFSEYLIREKMISVVPWDDAGHYIRFSVTFLALGEEEEHNVMKEIYRRLSGTKFIFD